MLNVTTWLWGKKYEIGYVDRLMHSVARNLRQPHRFVIFADRKLASNYKLDVRIIKRGRELLEQKGCFVRLQMFDPEFQRENGFDDRIVLIDLDTVVTGPLDPLFDRPDPFLILKGGNATNPCPYNGALQMLRPGVHADVWADFSIERAQTVPFDSFPDDQGWIWHKLPDAHGWQVGASTGAYVFRKPGWPGYEFMIHPNLVNDDMPKGARLVTFSGWRCPAKFSHLRWVRDHWRV